MNYSIDHCYIEEITRNGVLFAYKVTPFSGYVLRQTYTDEQGETAYTYIEGYVLIAKRNIEKMLPTLDAVKLD